MHSVPRKLPRAVPSTLRSTCAPQLSTARGYSAPPPKDQEYSGLHGRGRTHQGGLPTNFPDLIEHWTPGVFRKVGAGLAAASGGLVACGEPVLGAACAGVTSLYWYRGLKDLQDDSAIRRNFPVLGNVRYILESIRPEIRQYFIEGDNEATPFDRQHRNLAYQRAKHAPDTIPFGTRRDVYSPGYQFAGHSMWPTEVPEENRRVLVGGPDCKQPYSASLLNVSAMSYGALSDNAVLALNTAAARGGFYHNTGEGGISRFHLEPGGDLVWNVGTGYFGCGSGDMKRVFDPNMFADNSQRPSVKMIELKLSQGAKPGHGGILPKAKITQAIAEARGLPWPPSGDCNSPARHSTFGGPHELCEFLGRLRELSGGKPVGIKMCVGQPMQFAELCRAMIATGVTPDFITIDGAEGGTGAAPPEFSNSVGMPMRHGLSLIHSILVGADLRHKMKIICAGKILTGFSVVEALAIGADLTNSARGMMFALGCIQALKCNTNKCPTGITTLDPALMGGLIVPSKADRVQTYQAKTVKVALEIVGSMGLDSPSKVGPQHVFKTVSPHEVKTLYDLYPHLRIRKGSLLVGAADPFLQGLWDGVTPANIDTV